MLTEEKNRRQNILEEKIRQLSKEMLDEEGIRSISFNLADIYGGGFRHGYSGFFPLIVEISKNDQCSLDFLSNNLEGIRTYIEKDLVSGKKEFESIYVQAEKLCDHLNMEIGRWSYFSRNEQRIEDVDAQVEDLCRKESEATQRLEEASEQAASIQTELIAILSVFAAIVVTFSGSFTFLGSVMTSVNNAAYYEAVVLVAIICGMVVFNTIFLVMYLVYCTVHI